MIEVSNNTCRKMIVCTLLATMIMSVSACDMNLNTINDISQTTNIEQATTAPVYSLENMSAQDIISALKVKADVNTGDSVEAYLNSFPVPYMSVMEYDRNYAQDGYVFNNDNSVDHVIVIAPRIKEEMNRTYSVGRSSKVAIEIFIKDYAKASEIYEGIFAYYKELEPTILLDFNNGLIVVEEDGNGGWKDQNGNGHGWTEPTEYDGGYVNPIGEGHPYEPYYKSSLSDSRQGTGWWMQLLIKEWMGPADNAKYETKMYQTDDGYRLIIELPTYYI